MRPVARCKKCGLVLAQTFDDNPFIFKSPSPRGSYLPLALEAHRPACEGAELEVIDKGPRP